MGIIERIQRGLDVVAMERRMRLLEERCEELYLENTALKRELVVHDDIDGDIDAVVTEWGKEEPTIRTRVPYEDRIKNLKVVLEKLLKEFAREAVGVEQMAFMRTARAVLEDDGDDPT